MATRKAFTRDEIVLCIYAVNPITDLRPVCPNCHAVVHLGGCTRSIDEVREMLQSCAPG
jgi:5-methylcytosine-specific restriction protein A